jgi:hypothetical protein
MNTRLLITFFCLLLSQSLLAQDTIGDNLLQKYNTDGALRPIHDQDPKTISNKMVLYEDSLVYFMDSLTFTQNNEARNFGGDYFIKLMKGMLRQSNSSTHPFDDLKKVMNIIEAPDKTFRIFNWQIIKETGELRYFGLVQMSSGRIYPLIDVSSSIIRGAEDSVLTDMKWYGAIYYNILERNVNGEKKYFVLGFNGSGVTSNKKVIDCITFKNDKLIFGGAHFEFLIQDKTTANRIPKRFFAEYQKDAKVQLNWDNDAGLIIFDHLESSTGDLSKRYSYVPDGTYDGLKWTGSTWKIIPNAIAVVNTPESQVPVNLNLPKKVFQKTED